MIRKISALVIVCLGLAGCYLGDSGTKLMDDLQQRAAEDAAKSK